MPGVTAALRTFTLRAPAAGRVVGLAVTTGDSVHRGEVIAHIVNREEDAAQAGVEAAQKIDPERGGLARALSEALLRWPRYRSARAPGRAGHPARRESRPDRQRIRSAGRAGRSLKRLRRRPGPDQSARRDSSPGWTRRSSPRSNRASSTPRASGRSLPVSRAGGTTAPVWVQFTGPDRISEIGASVEVHVTIRFVPDAIVIPAAALFEDAERHNSYVFTVGADSRAHRTVVDHRHSHPSPRSR